MERSPEARHLLSKCGENIPLQNKAMDALKSYVIRCVHVELNSTSQNIERAIKWKEEEISGAPASR